MIRYLLLILATTCALLGQNVQRVVPTVADLLRQDPRTFAASSLEDGTNFLASVITSGDTSAGTNPRLWVWDGSSTGTTNAISFGTNSPLHLAFPYGATSGRWVWVVGQSGGGGEFPTLTANRALVTDGSGAPAASAVTSTELGRLSGITDSITTLLAGKQATVNGAASTITAANLTAGKVMISDDGGKAAVSSVNAAALLDIGGTNAAPDLPWIDVTSEGAVPNDGTSDSTSFLRTATNAVARGKWVRFPTTSTNAVSRYLLDPNTLASGLDGLTIYIPPGSELAPTSYPTGNYSTSDRVNSLISVGNGFKVFGGGAINGRSDEGSFTQSPANLFVMLKAQQVSHVAFEDIVIKNTYDAPIYGREATNLVVRNCRWDNTMQGYNLYNCYRPVIENDYHDTMKMTNSVGGAYVTLQSCSYPYVRGSHFKNLVSHTRSNTQFSAVFNEFGCDNGVFADINFDGVASNTTIPPIAFLLDGGSHNTLRGCRIIGYGGSSSQGINIEGEHDYWINECVLDGSHPTKGALSNGSAGIYSTEWRIETLDELAYGLRWRDPGHQWRGRSIPTRGKITNNKIFGFHTGIVGSFSQTVFEANEIYATSYAAIRLNPSLSYGFGFGSYPIQHLMWQNVIRGNKIFNNTQHGVMISGGEFTQIIENQFWNNNNTGSAFDIATDWFNTGNNGTITGGTNFVHNLSLSANQVAGMVAYWPGSDVSGIILTNTTTTFTLTGPMSSTPSNGDPFVICYGKIGRTTVHNNWFYNTANLWSVTNLVSIDPSQDISVANTPFCILSAEMAVLEPGMQVQLNGVLTGGANLRAVIRNVDLRYPDRVWAVAIVPSTGTFETATNGTSIFPGSGLVTWVDNPSSYEASGRLTVTGNGTVFSQELDGNYFIKIGEAPWIDTVLTGRAINWDTNIYISRPFTIGSNLVSQPFLYSKVRATWPQTTGPALRWSNNPGTLDLANNWIIDKNIGTNVYPAGFITGNAPNLIWTLRSSSGALNSTYPKIAFGNNNITKNTSATTITNFIGWYEGMAPIRVTAQDNDTTLDFTSASTSLKGYTNNITLAVGDAWEMWWSLGKWNVRVYQ